MKGRLNPSRRQKPSPNIPEGPGREKQSRSFPENTINHQVLKKIPFRFISNAGAFGEKRMPSALLILPSLIRR